MSSRLGAQVAWRPEYPNGEKRRFNCCMLPEVRRKVQGDGAECANCGYDWTEAEP